MGKVEVHNLDTLHRRQHMGHHHKLQTGCWETSPWFGFHRRKLQSMDSMASIRSNCNQLKKLIVSYSDVS